MLSHYKAIKQVRTNLDEKIEALVLCIGDETSLHLREGLKDNLDQMQEEFVSLTNDMLVIAQCEREPDYHWSH